MACFIVPATEAIVTTVAAKIIKKKSSESGIRFAGKLNHLNGLLWGGSGLLAFEHLWHGEITPFFPFLTATADSESAQRMLYEMSTSGVAMATVVTAVWAVSVILGNIITKKSSESLLKEEKQ